MYSTVGAQQPGGAATPMFQRGFPGGAAATSAPRMRDTVLRRLLREPLLQFLVCGGFLFAAAHGIGQLRDQAEREIVIDGGVTRRLSSLYEMQTGSAPSKQKLEALLDDYVLDEVLFREAKRLGLDHNDEIIRRRLAQKLEFLQRDMLAVAEPSDDELRKFYQVHQDSFGEPARVNFTHIYFTPDQGGDGAARRRAAQALDDLRGRDSVAGRALGDPFPLQRDYANLALLDVAQLFGQSPIAEALFAAAKDEWVGPFQSGYGWHLIYVGERREAATPPFEKIKGRVRDAYVDDVRERDNAQKLAELKARYVVSRVYDNSKDRK